jgi:ATP-dependent Clp protease ATP-binding subunit ClpA
MPEIRQFFRIEFINRIDAIIAFHPLGLADLMKIAALRFRDLQKRLRERGITSEITSKATRAIAELSHDPQFGARPINRFIQNRLENPLSRILLAGKLQAGAHLAVDFRDGDFLFNGETAEDAGHVPSGADEAEGGADEVRDAEFEEV